MSKPQQLGFYMPAEWERHKAVWIAWPYDPITFPDRVRIVEHIYIEMISALHASEHVHLLVKDSETQERVERLLREKSAAEFNVTFHVTDYADVWVRDYGPTFIKHSGTQEIAMVDWIYNAYGNKYPELVKDTNIPKWMESELRMKRFEPNIVMEGGSIEVNGNGTLITTKQCLLNENRNPALTQIEIEEYLKNYLGVQNIIWLDEGIVGDDTDGHIDDLARFVNPTTIVTAYTDDTSDENYQILKKNFEILSSARDQNGNPFTVVKLPMPGKFGDEEGRLPASYANFYIGNTVVLVPTFKHKNDADALRIIQNFFSDRKVIGINATDMVYGMGTFHCATQQQPE